MRAPRAVFVVAGISSLALAAALVSHSPASAAGESLGVSLYSADGHQIQFSVCLTAGDALPARLNATYSVSGVPGSVDWSEPDPESILLGTEPCPNAFVTFAVNDLTPSTSYTIAVHAELVPKVEDDDGNFVDDTSRSTVILDSSLVASTTDGISPDDGTGGDDSAGGGDSTDGGANPGSPGGSTGGGTPSGGGSTGGAVAPVVISNPAIFTSTQLLALTPAQVATIAPSAFGQLPPATFKALTAPQAAALTVEQASSIRAARAAELRPSAVAALTPDAVAAMRPSAIKFLSPAAVKAMTFAQLRALTPRQVAALRPLQLAELTAAEKALLRVR